MLQIKSLSPIEFKKYADNKKVIIFGAGRALESCLDIYFSKKEIDLIVDNNEKLKGTSIIHNGKKVVIEDVRGLVEYVDNKSVLDFVLFINSPFYGPEIVDQLDLIPQLDQMECFLQILIRNTIEKNEEFEFTNGPVIIPKKINYIWLGGNPLPIEFERNIDSWKRFNPEYEIIEWNESNTVMDSCDYIKEAYKAKAWGFVSNYLRLKIIFEEGGIYLDTDVEAIGSFDKLLKDKAFFNMGCSDRINNGCGFGAEKKSAIVKRMLDEYENSHFLDKNGTPKMKQGHTFLHSALKENGFEIVNKYQNYNGIALYPSEVMSPLTISGMPNNISNKTVSIHKEAGSWKSEREQKAAERLEEFIRERLINA